MLHIPDGLRFIFGQAEDSITTPQRDYEPDTSFEIETNILRLIVLVSFSV